MSIPVSQIVNVQPGVLGVGGAAVDLNGLFLTANTRVPIGSVQVFSSPTDVNTYFGSSSAEATEAAVYFTGFTNGSALPGAMLFYQYNAASVGAYLRGGSLAAMTLAQLQALTSGTVIATIDGVVHTSSSINLSTATSFSAAASIIGADLGIAGPPNAVFTGAISGTVLTVSALSSGALAVGSNIGGTSVTVGTYITSLGTGTGGTGTYNLSASQTVGSEAMTGSAPGVVFDSVTSAFEIVSSTVGPSSTIGFATGTLAATLALTAAAGAVTSQGAAAATPAGAMNAVIAITTNWATFSTMFDPDSGALPPTNKLAFALWTSQQNNRYLYVAWDTDITPTASNPAAASLGNILEALGYSGTATVYQPSQLHLSTFIQAIAASVDFTETNGRATFAFRRQGGLQPSITTQTAADDLIANGYNYYGAYATAAEAFSFLYPGSVSGPFEWIDTYINQIKLNSSLQASLIALLLSAKSIPYNIAGYTQIEAAVSDPISAALNFGSIRAGVTLSASQVQQVNSDAGANIAGTLQTRGWYFQVQDASPVVRAARGSPPCKLWYTDGESVQAIHLSSIALL